MKTVLVTGAAGFCATHLAQRLGQLGGFRVVGFDRHEPDAAFAGLWAEFMVADLGDDAVVEGLLRGARPEWVFHLAGRTIGTRDELFAANEQGTRQLLDGVRRAAPEAAVLVVGSAAEYGVVASDAMPIREEQACRPSSEYGRSKLAATNVALDARRRARMRVVVARPFNVIGAGVPPYLVVGAIIERLRRLATGDGNVLRVGRLDTQRDFIAVEDLIETYIAILRGEHWGEIMNVCSGVPTSIATVADALVRISALPVRMDTDPSLVRADDVQVSYGSRDKAQRLLGISPTISLERALESAWHGAPAAAAAGVLAQATGRSRADAP